MLGLMGPRMFGTPGVTPQIPAPVSPAAVAPVVPAAPQTTGPTVPYGVTQALTRDQFQPMRTPAPVPLARTAPPQAAPPGVLQMGGGGMTPAQRFDAITQMRPQMSQLGRTIFAGGLAQ